LCPEDFDHVSFLDKLPKTEYEISPFLVQVSEYPPLTRQQFDEWCQHWPFSTPRPLLSSALDTKTLIKDSEITYIKQHMLAAIEEAQLSKQDPEAAEIVGVVIVDPSTQRVVARAHDRSKKNPLHHPIFVALTLLTSSSYLCSGFNLFITKEPCIMCSMALVHSRIGKVFYGTEDKDSGGLGGLEALHTLPALNHHFGVFKGILRRQCLDLSL
jgi:tRNA-specific adenosine deaminase 3